MEEEAKAEGKKRKAKKKQSLKHQITLNFIGLLLLSILTIFIINVLFLESYYVSKKKEILLQARATLSTLDIDALVHNDGTTEEIASEIVQTGSRNNLSWVLVNPDNSKYICWPENEGQLRSKLFFGYASDLDQDRGNGKVLEKSDDYVVQKIHDRFAGMDYVECWGCFENGNYFLIRTPLSSIRESAAISNKFYFFVGNCDRAHQRDDHLGCYEKDYKAHQ